MVKHLITEISEEDFRKLDLKVKVHRRTSHERNSSIEWIEQSLNDVLQENIDTCLKAGYEEDHANLTLPVTIAIHEDGGYYLDKFMNRFTGAQTYQLAMGIGKLYSTRDYYEMRGDYWRVRKDETKVIYRVKLSDKWLDQFVLKHKTEVEDWPFNELPDGVSPDYTSGKLISYFDREGEDSLGKTIWKPVGFSAMFVYGQMKQIFPVDKDGNKIKPEWAELPTGPGVN